MTKLGTRKWFSFILAGIIGQLAWAIENNYLNLYVHDSTQTWAYVPIMTAASALAATLTTLFMGALSDRLGKRKAFISFGYILWGLSIIAFAFLSPNSSMSFVGSSLALSGSLIVIMDCVMTFFGSTANDAAFNAFVTDNTDTTNRGKVESVLSVMPLIALVMVLGATMVLPGKDLGGGNKLTTDWDLFFIILGAITIIAGIACIFLLPKDIKQPNKSEPYMANIIYGFRPKVIKQNKMLYVVLTAFMLFNIGVQVFMPYYMGYIQKLLGDSWIIALAIVLVVAIAITVVFGLFMDKIGKNKILIPSLIVAVIGCILMTIFTEPNMALIIIGATIVMVGYLVGTAVLGAKVRDYTPENDAGLFQGVRMVFVVLIPMCTGPFIGLGISGNSFDKYWEGAVEANNFMFLGAAIGFVIAAIPLIYLIIKEKKHETA